MHLVIFEGSRWPSFAPLSLNRPVFSLLCGMSSLLEKQIRHIVPTRLTLWVRPQLVDYCRTIIAPSLSIPVAINEPLDDEPALLSSGRALHLSKFIWPTEPSVTIDEGDLVRKAYVKSPGLSPQDCTSRSDAWLKLLQLPRAAEQARLPEYLWDLIHWNEEALVSDAIALRDQPHPLPDGPFHALSPQEIFISPDVKIQPGVVLDAGGGPIVVDAGAALGANCVLQGPCYVGRHSSVSALSFIRAGTTVGQMCKVGGEIGDSILQGYSNKVHEGFVGHSYLGEWVNIGSGTTTSNLKNTYGPIRVRIAGREIETNRRFLGAMIGDHTKTGIGTRLNAGTYVGYCTMLASTAVPQFVPSFKFVTDKGPEPYRMDKARQVMAQVYDRRGRSWTPADETMLAYVQQAAGVIEK